ncbi:hypothetical protein [Streptomyces bobili]
MPGAMILAALLLIAYLLLGALALLRCRRKDIHKVLRTLIGRRKQ